MTPAYTIRNPPLPTELTLSRARLDKKSNANHDKNVERLNKFRKTFASKKQFWVEATVMDRLYYKNINSQKRFVHFRYVSQTRQLLKRLKSLDLNSVMDTIYKSFWQAKTIEKCEGPWNFIPTKELAEYTMHRIIAAALILDKLQATLMVLFNEHSKTLTKGHFGSLMLVVMGASSRLYRLAHAWVNELGQCYRFLQSWHTAFPSGIKPSKRQPTSIDQTCNPSTFLEARQSAMESWSGKREIPGILFHGISISVPQPLASTEPSNAASPVAEQQRMPVQYDDELDLGEVIERS